MKSNVVSNRFALADRDGRIIALVADGLPEWPDDLTSLEDDNALATMESAYLAEFDRLAALPEPTAEDEQAASTLAQRVRSLRDEAARRYAAVADAGTEGGEGGEGSETPPAPGAPAAEGGEGGEGGAEGGEGRASSIAALRAGLDTPPAPAPELESVEGMGRQDIAQLIADGARSAAEAAATAATTAVITALGVQSEPTGSSGRRVTAADLSGFRPDHLAPAPGAVRTAPRLPARLLTSADIPSMQMGTEITTMTALRDAMIRRHGALGRSSGVDDESIPVATLAVEVPSERDLRNLDWAEARSKVQAMIGPEAVGVDPWTGKEALVAAGGLAAPVQPYYGQLVIAQGARPVRDALPTFAADRGGIQLVLPPSLATLAAVTTTTGVLTDAVVASGDATVTSASGAFTAADVGSIITGPGIPTGTRVLSINSGTSLEMTVNATASTNPATIYIAGRNPNNLGAPVGLQSLAQDAANGIKYTYDVPNAAKVEFDVYAVYTSLQFGNIQSRTFPELVEANIRLADALAARVAETQMLDVITAWSTLMTGAKTFGTARQLLAQLIRMAAWYRNSERMDPNAVLRVGLPVWAAQAMSADWLSTFIGTDLANAAGVSDDEIAGILQRHRLMPFWYQDGPSDVSQLFATSGVSAATNTGVNSASPMAIPDYPGTGSTTSFRTKIVSFMWAEGTWLGLTTGELNLGLVRDSILNSQNRFRNFQEEWETPAFVGTRSLRGVHTVASDGSYGAAASVVLGAGSGL